MRAKDMIANNDVEIKGLPLVTTIMVVGVHCFGYGKTIKEARERAKQNARKENKKGPFEAYLGDDTIDVDGMGYISAEHLICLGEV